ncbi:MAG: hypothetical protein U5Q03_15120 [Bacteroidota bacterium]|nr:hypothetical protein [Bacteroidota bacterium]
MAAKLGINIQMITRVIGFLLIVEGFFMFSGIPFALYYCQKCYALIYSGAITAATGGLLMLLALKPKNKNIGKREGYIIVSFTWVVISLSEPCLIY